MYLIFAGKFLVTYKLCNIYMLPSKLYPDTIYINENQNHKTKI